MIEIANAVARFFAAVDRRDWAGLRAMMASPFCLDYSSFGGGLAADHDPDQIIETWKTLLPGFDCTHHQIGNLDIRIKDDGAATALCHGTATHYIAGAEGGPVWTVVGSYTLDLVQQSGAWVLTGCTFHFKYQDGNLALPALAQKRAAQQT